MVKRKHVITSFIVLLTVSVSWWAYRSYGGQGITTTRKKRVIVLAIDGMEWDVINPLLEKGKLPNLKYLMDNGVYGNLTSLKPTLSPLIWATIATGKTPEKHGIKDFLIDGVPVTSNVRRTKAIWNILSEQEYTVGTVGYYTTWPVEEVNGFMISDRLGLRNIFMGLAYPPRIMDGFYIRKLLEFFIKLEFITSTKDVIKPDRFTDDFTINPFHPLYDRKSSRFWNSFLAFNGLIRGFIRDENYFQLGEFLYKKHRPNFFVIYLSGVDRASHSLWRYYEPEEFNTTVDPQGLEKLKDVIPNYYSYMDEKIGRFIELADRDTTIIVLSDHGFKARDYNLANLGENSKNGYWFEHGNQNTTAWHLSGGHDINGVVVMSGPCIKRNNRITNASVYDITPTILGLMDIPIGEDMDGRFLTQIIDPECADKIKIRYVDTHDDEEAGKDHKPIKTGSDEEIKDRLRDLGYID